MQATIKSGSRRKRELSPDTPAVSSLGSPSARDLLNDQQPKTAAAGIPLDADPRGLTEQTGITHGDQDVIVAKTRPELERVVAVAAGMHDRIGHKLTGDQPCILANGANLLAIIHGGPREARSIAITWNL